MSRKRVLRNIAWMFFERIVVTLAVLGSNIFVVRSLGPEKFGELSYWQAIFGLLVVGADFGLRRVLMVAYGGSASGQLVSAALLLKTAVCFLLAAACGIVFANNHDPALLLLALFCVFAPLEVYVFVLQSELRNDVLAKARTALALAGAAARVWLCLIDLGTVIWLLTTYVVQSVILFVGVWWWKQREADQRAKISFARFGRIWHLSRITLSRSIYFFLSMLLIQAHYRVDQLMVARFAGDAELGIYSSAYKLVEQLLMIPGIISAVLLPAMALDRKNAELTRSRLALIYSATLIASVLLAIPAMVFADPIIRIAFGSEFLAAGNVLFYLMLGVPFLFLANMSGLYFSVFGREREAFMRNGLGLSLNIALNLYMIPRHGAVGAALSTIASYFMVALGTEMILHRRFREHLMIKWVSFRNLFSPVFYKEIASVLQRK